MTLTRAAGYSDRDKASSIVTVLANAQKSLRQLRIIINSIQIVRCGSDVGGCRAKLLSAPSFHTSSSSQGQSVLSNEREVAALWADLSVMQADPCTDGGHA